MKAVLTSQKEPRESECNVLVNEELTITGSLQEPHLWRRYSEAVSSHFRQLKRNTQADNHLLRLCELNSGRKWYQLTRINFPTPWRRDKESSITALALSYAKTRPTNIYPSYELVARESGINLLALTFPHPGAKIQKEVSTHFHYLLRKHNRHPSTQQVQMRLAYESGINLLAITSPFVNVEMRAFVKDQLLNRHPYPLLLGSALQRLKTVAADPPHIKLSAPYTLSVVRGKSLKSIALDRSFC